MYENKLELYEWVLTIIFPLISLEPEIIRIATNRLLQTQRVTKA